MSAVHVSLRSTVPEQIESIPMLMEREVRAVAVLPVDRRPANVLRWVERAMWTGLAIIAVVLILLIGLLAWSLFAEGIEAPPSRDYSADIQRLFRATNTCAPHRRRTNQFTRHANNKTNYRKPTE